MHFTEKRLRNPFEGSISYKRHFTACYSSIPATMCILYTHLLSMTEKIHQRLIPAIIKSNIANGSFINAHPAFCNLSALNIPVLTSFRQ